MEAEKTIRSPQEARNRQTKLAAFKEQNERDLAAVRSELEEIRKYLALSERVTEALDSLSQQLFRELLDVIEHKLTIALQEVLEQPIALKSGVDWKRNAASVDFWIEREGNKEDIMKGQGGSVANILSVGLRLFALTTLDESRHRRFLVLDEQDCWLHPDLVTPLVKIIHEAGRALNFQILMVSHHDSDLFRGYADRVYRLVSHGEKGVRVTLDDEGDSVTSQKDF